MRQWVVTDIRTQSDSSASYSQLEGVWGSIHGVNVTTEVVRPIQLGSSLGKQGALENLAQAVWDVLNRVT